MKNNSPAVPLRPFLDAPKPDRVFSRKELVWDGLQLRLGRGRIVATVEPDAKWPGMYRVRCAGKLSEMVNLTRAKDAKNLGREQELTRAELEPQKADWKGKLQEFLDAGGAAT